MNAITFTDKSPTAQVRILCESLLNDCQPHTRREMEDYILSQMALLGLPRPTHGCLAGGIRNAIQRKNCIKLGTAKYQATMPDAAEDTTASRIQRASECIKTAINTLSSLAREIDFIEANASEAIELNKLKNCIVTLKELNHSLVD